MGLRNGRLSEIMWYGLGAGFLFMGISAYKPRYFLAFSKVQRI
jgi:hypothetical protein